jgi:hypothetical protein
MDFQELAEKAVKESAELTDFAYTGDVDLGKTWAMTFSKSRDSNLMEVSNYESIKKDLEKRFPKDVSDERFSHWAVGWIDHLLVRMLDKRGKITKAGVAALEWRERLEDYPAADESDLSDREYEATIENIKSEGGLDEQTAKDVFSWLWDNDQMALEDVDGQGGYPSRKQIDSALKALGVLESEEDEDGEELPEPPSPLYDDPQQLRFWPKGLGTR